MKRRRRPTTTVVSDDNARTVSVRELRANLSELLGAVRFGGARVIIRKNGKPACTLISMADYGRLIEADQRSARPTKRRC